MTLFVFPLSHYASVDRLHCGEPDLIRYSLANKPHYWPFQMHCIYQTPILTTIQMESVRKLENVEKTPEAVSFLVNTYIIYERT